MIEDIVKVIGAVGAIYLVMKTTIEIQSLKISKRQVDYDFTKRILEDVRIWKHEVQELPNDDRHRRIFQVEKGIRALTGRMMSIEEFEYLIAQKSPSLSILRRNNSASFIGWREDGRGYDWTGVYQRPWARKFGPRVLELAYYASALPAVFVFFTMGSAMFKNAQLSFTCGVLVAQGVLCVWKSESWKSAKKFMDEHQSGTQQENFSNNRLKGEE